MYIKLKKIQAIILICIFGTLAAEHTPDNTTSSLKDESSQNAQQQLVSQKELLLEKSLLDGEVHFNVTYNHTICVMFAGSFTFSVTYLRDNDNMKNTSTAEVHIPTASDPNVKVDGSCSTGKGQWIEIMWGNDLPKSRMKLLFNSSDYGQSWILEEVEAVIVIDKENFINAKDSGKVLKSSFDINFSPRTVPTSRSYKCFSEVSDINSTTYLNDKHYPYPVFLSIAYVQIQAYNHIPYVSEFAVAKYCDLDRAADKLPLIVGCSIFSVMVLILLAHFCCPRDHRYEYDRI